MIIHFCDASLQLVTKKLLATLSIWEQLGLLQYTTLTVEKNTVHPNGGAMAPMAPPLNKSLSYL